MANHVEVIHGSSAASWGARLAKVDVIPAYPITPQTGVVETVAKFVESGAFDCRFIRVESEHSAMAAAIGASAAGARAFTATSSHGLLFMFEMMAWAAGARTPVVMANINRSLGPPWGIWVDINDSLSVRDLGWIQFYTKNNQEVLDTTIQAFKVAEHEEVCLPTMLSLAGFLLSHTHMPVDIPDQELVNSFLPKYDPKHFVLDPENPIAHGSLSFPKDIEIFRLNMHDSMNKALEVIVEVNKEWADLTGRSYGNGLLEPYFADDAEFLFVTMGTDAEEAEIAIDLIRKEGINAGLLRVKTFRPFPEKEILKWINKVKFVTVLDRNISLGYGGILAGELRSIRGLGSVLPMYEHVKGLGGVDVTAEDMVEIMKADLKRFEGGGN